MKKIELDEQRFGKLLVKNWTNYNGRGMWLCHCDCGKSTLVPSNSLTSGRTQSCGCLLHEKPWKGVGDLSGNYWYRLGKSAKMRGWDFDISIEHGWELFIKQNKKCNLTAIDLHMEPSYLNPRRKDVVQQTASLDRIDSKMGYIVGNVQWVHVDVNYMKQDLSQDAFIVLCRKVVEHDIARVAR